MVNYSPKTWATNDAIDAATLNTEFGAIEDVVNNVTDANIANGAISPSKLSASSFYATLVLQGGDPTGAAIAASFTAKARVPYAATIERIDVYIEEITAGGDWDFDIQNEGSSVDSGGATNKTVDTDIEFTITPDQNTAFSAGDQISLVCTRTAGNIDAYVIATVLFKDTITS